MKILLNYFRNICLFSICGLLAAACQNKDKEEPDPQQVDTLSVSMLDSIANHFKFIGADEISGKIPAGTGGGSLKFSIKDTLHLIQGVYFPIKFLNDTSSNVTGVFIQVVGVKGGQLGSSYFDVPELTDLDEDTVSIVIVGFDPPTGSPVIVLPESFNIKIVPHNDKDQPLDEVIMPVKVDKLNDDANASVCGLTGGYWKWMASYIPPESISAEMSFENNPDKIWGRTGQIIKGSCCAGISIYGICPGEREPNASLHFSTYSQYLEEDITFYENGNFFRQTLQNNTNPLPDESDFCSNAEGMVKNNITSVSYQGNYIVEKIHVPERFKNWYTTRNRVALNQTSSSNFGYGNPGGVIHQLTCDYMVLIQLDPEGFGQDLFKFYERKNNYQGDDEDDWYDIPED